MRLSVELDRFLGALLASLRERHGGEDARAVERLGAQSQRLLEFLDRDVGLVLWGKEVSSNVYNGRDEPGEEVGREVRAVRLCARGELEGSQHIAAF